MTAALPARFMSKVEQRADGCWIWKASSWVNGCGLRYGGYYYEGRHQAAHRAAYKMARGPIPEGLTLDHLCRVTLCVNPEHLEAVTLTENILRGEGWTAQRARSETCIQGHPLSGPNLYVNPKGERYCRICKRRHYREWYHRARIAARAKEGK